MTKRTITVVHTDDFNGHSADFLMATDDFRHPLVDPKWGYTLVTTGKRNVKARTFAGDNGKTYTVFSDWSVRAN